MISNRTIFADRAEAGRALAQLVAQQQFHNPIVLALPRGGVPVGYEVAKAIGAPLDIIMVRKIGAPGHKEYGIGALVDGSAPQVMIDEQAAKMTGATEEYLKHEVAAELAEIERRRADYRTGPPLPVKGRTAIVVDDGIATGNTAEAALQALAKAGPASIILAVPVAPPDSLQRLKGLCDSVICLATPVPFYAVGAHYHNFGQTTDEEVVELLSRARQDAAAAAKEKRDNAG